jgi:hypothetical protein
MGMMRDARMVGKAGEYAVAAQLLLRDVLVLWPAVDQGYDLETENHCRLQVRCGHLSNSDGRASQHYAFMLRKRKPVPISNTVAKVVPQRPFAEVCDFVVFWGIEQNRFWIVPPALCDGCAGIRLGMEPVTRPRLVANIADVKEMVSLGYSQTQIAKHYGTTRCVIQRFLSEGRDWDASVVSKMRACENDWEKVTNFVRVAPSIVRDEAPKENFNEGI